MRILQLISSSGFFGAENVVLALAKELRDTNIEVTVGVFENRHNPHLELAQEAQKNGVPVAVFPVNGRIDPGAIFRIRSFLDTQKINLIHSHGYKSNLYALASTLGKKTSLVCTCHNWLGSTPKMKFYAGLDKFFLNQFDRIVAVSKAVEDDILSHNVVPTKVTTVCNGVQIDRFTDHQNTDALRKELGIHKKATIIGTVGRLSEEKGHSFLLEAAEIVLQKYPETVFLIIGDGPLRQHLETLAIRIIEKYKNNGASATPIVFAGTRTDVEQLYPLMDLFVLPSLTEGLPMVLLEAMASNTPIVATRVGAIPSIIENNRSGVLVQPGHMIALAEAMMDLLQNPPKAKAFAKQAFAIVGENYSSKKMAQAYADLYSNVVGLPANNG